MVQIEPFTTQSPPDVAEQARALFREYGEFLRSSGGQAFLNFSRLDAEIDGLPAAYTSEQGEVLLAMDQSIAMGCIAYRALLTANDANCCEIKRLFVSPRFRARGLGRRLITTALDRARSNGYQTACLDTEPLAMAAAQQLYRDLGFVEDHERSAESEIRVVFFKKSLEGAS